MYLASTLILVCLVFVSQVHLNLGMHFSCAEWSSINFFLLHEIGNPSHADFYSPTHSCVFEAEVCLAREW